jgi:hypothetical protein
MRDLLLLAVQLVVSLAKFMRPGGVRSVIAESLLVKHQLIISGRSRRRAPPLTTSDRFVLGLMVLFVRPRRIARLAAILKPATLLRFHKALVDRKYRHLFSSARTGTRCKPGPKGPAEEIISAILEMKLRNPRFGNQRIAEQISHVFAVQIDKDVVRRVLATHYGPEHPGASGPSWLTFFAQAKDSLWSVTYSVANRYCFVAIGSLWSSTCLPAASSTSASAANTSTVRTFAACSIRPLPVTRRRRGSVRIMIRCSAFIDG